MLHTILNVDWSVSYRAPIVWLDLGLLPLTVAHHCGIGHYVSIMAVHGISQWGVLPSPTPPCPIATPRAIGNIFKSVQPMDIHAWLVSVAVNWNIMVPCHTQ